MRKNILILAHSYGMQFVEGCNQYAQLFDKDQYKVTVVYLIGAEDNLIKQKTEAEKVIFMNLTSRSLRGLKWEAIHKILKLCRKYRFEMVFCHRYKPAYIMLWVSLLCRIPKIFFIMHALETMKSIPRRLLMAALWRNNITMIGVSEAVCQDLRQDLWRVPHQYIKTFYNIMDYELFEPQLLARHKARDILKIPAQAFVFGNIGRLVKEKDQKSLINAFYLIKDQCPNAKLVFIGDGKLEQELKAQVQELNLSDSVIFAGFIPDGFRFMKAFDIFILNSIEEAFGRVLLEAMVAYTPIIATRTHGIPEVVGDTGFIVEPKNPQALAEIMLKTYHLPKTDLALLGEKAYDRMARTFSIQRFKKDFWETVQERG
jgi:glycosyltransferase involved in cell wall biosynthesis